MKTKVGTLEHVLKHTDKPTHITYIANYLLKCSVDTARERIKPFLEDGTMYEYEHAKDYFGTKQ
jgi:acetyl-CoA carboxylase carboxyltransferase component